MKTVVAPALSSPTDVMISSTLSALCVKTQIPSGISSCASIDAEGKFMLSETLSGVRGLPRGSRIY